jgi:peroxin-19
MPGTTSEKDPKGKSQKAELSPEEEEKAFQRAIEIMLSKEGMDAMGLTDDLGLDVKPSLPKSTPKSKPKQGASTSSGAGTRNTETDTKPDISSFEETIRKAMESLNTAGTKPASGPGGDPTDPADLAKLLASLGNDPNLDLEGDDELSGILDGMMGQLMTREVLEEPMAELASKVSRYSSFSSSRP